MAFLENGTRPTGTGQLRTCKVQEPPSDWMRRFLPDVPTVTENLVSTYSRWAGDQQTFANLIAATFGEGNAVFAAIGSRVEQFWSTSFDPDWLHQVLLPPNLRGVKGIDAVTVLDFVKDEGIPLYLVPRRSIAVSLLRAKDSGARRAILGRRSAEILSDCEAMLRTPNLTLLQSEIGFALEAIAAAQDGHHSAAQALASNTLDSMLRTLFRTDKARKKVTLHRRGDTGEHLDDLDVQAACALTPVWISYEEFWESQGHPVPRKFSRHGSTHRVSSRQFSKRNAVQGIMLVASLAGWANEKESTARIGRTGNTPR